MNLLPKDRAETILNLLNADSISERGIARQLEIDRKTVMRYKRWGLHSWHISPPKVRVRTSSPKRVELAYPYIAKCTAGHADLVAVNAIVPKAYPDAMRADICQEIMLALLEGRTTLDELRHNRQKSAWFLKKFYADNFEAAGHAISLCTDDDGSSYDEIASSIAAKEWHREQYAEHRRYADAIRTFVPATQVEDIWRKQIHRRAEAAGLSFDEMAEVMK